MSDDRRSRMLAILLGASTFPSAPTLSEGRAFYLSAADVKDYLCDEQCLAIPRQNVLSLFDDSRSPSDQLVELANFLVRRTLELKSEGSRPEDLLIYYVGHGLFAQGDQAYCLAVRSTNQINEGATSIRTSDLAGVIKENAAFLRRYLILDCCFAASIHKEFQSSALTAARRQIATEFPERGTALLCSSSAREPSLAPQGLNHTMFSQALLEAVHQGHDTAGPRLSFSQLGDVIKENLRQRYPESWVRPEVHSPDQREGDIAQIPLFPNPAYREPVEPRTEPAEERRQKTRGKRREREHAEAKPGKKKSKAEGFPAAAAQPSIIEKPPEEQIVREKPKDEPEPLTRTIPLTAPGMPASTLVWRFQAFKIWMGARPLLSTIAAVSTILVLLAVLAKWHSGSNHGPVSVAKSDPIGDLEKLGWKIDKTHTSAKDRGPGYAANALVLQFDGIPPQSSFQALEGLPSAFFVKLGGIDDSISEWATLKNLSGLDLSDTKTDDVSPLKSLTQLKELDLSRTNIGDLSPLANLTNLSVLRLQETKVLQNLTPLKGLTRLSTLVITDSKIRDISPIKDLTSLSILDLSMNLDLHDLSPLTNLTGLSALNVSYQQTDLSRLSSLTNLSLLVMSDTKAPDRSLLYLKDLKKLSALDLSAFNDNKLRDISPLIYLSNLSTLGLNSCNHVSDISALRDLENLTALDLAYTPVSDLSALKDLPRLRRLSLLWAKGVKDISPLSGLADLSSLELYGTSVTDLSPLRNLANLAELSVDKSADLSPLKQLKNLRVGDIARNSISYDIAVQFARMAGSRP